VAKNGSQDSVYRPVMSPRFRSGIRNVTIGKLNIILLPMLLLVTAFRAQEE